VNAACLCSPHNILVCSSVNCYLSCLYAPVQTAHTGTFMLYELSKHPEVQEKVRSEVLSVLGDSGEADAETLQKMPYLIQVIRETQRSIATSCLFVLHSCLYCCYSSMSIFCVYKLRSVAIKVFCSCTQSLSSSY